MSPDGRAARHDAPAAACKLCGVTAREFISRNGFEILKCPRCGFMFAPIPPGYDLEAVYADDRYWNGGVDYGYTGGFDGWWRAVASFYEARLAQLCQFGAGSRMLEIGCADGRFLETARKRGFEVAGVELSEMMRARCERRLKCQVWRSIDGPLARGERYDCVAIFEVIEHLPDPLAVLADVARLAAPGAIIAISTPNFDCEAAVKSPESFAPFSPPVHLSFFGPASLRRCVEGAGFRTLAVKACFAAQELPIRAGIAAILKPFRRGKRLRPGGLIGRFLKADARRRAMRMAFAPDAMRLGQTLELYARRT